MVPQINRHGIDATPVNRKDTVAVVCELGKPVHVLPDLITGSVEQMRAVNVIFDAGLRIDFRPSIATHMRALFKYQYRDP